MIKNRVFALSFRAFAFVFCLFSVLWNLGTFFGEFSGISLLYYTLQSNVLVVVMFGLLTVYTAIGLKRGGKKGSASYFPRISANVTLGIFLTLLVFWTMLARTRDAAYLSSFDNLGVHLFNPLLMIADYVLFSEGGKLKKYDPFIFAALPIGYLIQATILGFSGVNYSQVPGETARFPYFFMDYYETGAWVALYIIGLAAFYIGLSFLLWFIDFRRAKRLKKLGEAAKTEQNEAAKTDGNELVENYEQNESGETGQGTE
jgi:hypothetical protein